MNNDKSYIRCFGEIGLGDLGTVGGKNASLGELYRELGAHGIKVPNGFAVTADAYKDCLRQSGAGEQLRRLLDGLDKTDVAELAKRAAAAREIVYASTRDAELRAQIGAAYRRLQEQYGPDLSVAVRSSATAEDLPTASFAGQHDSYLNVQGGEQLFDACRRCFSSLFTDRAISYRIDQGFDHFAISLSVGVMKMVRSDLAASGVIFTLDTESGFRDVVLVTGSYGLGENIVRGVVDPDEFYVHKPTFTQGFRTVVSRNLGAKAVKMIYAQGRTREAIRNVPTPRADTLRFCISDDEVLTLADNAIAIEDHYSRKAGRSMPMDIEWAKDGKDGQLYVLQARPETVASQRSAQLLKEYQLKDEGRLLAVGRAVGTGIVAGPLRIVTSARQLAEFRPGEILVADTTTPDWEPVMKTAAAIVTNHGGRTCHAAIIARELGIPAVVGAIDATERLAGVVTATVACTSDVGKVYEGALRFELRETDVTGIGRPTTKIMVNLGNPDLAFRTSMLPNDGVGLARMEFIIQEHIGIHPMALLHPERIIDEATRAAVMARARHYSRPADLFVQRLSEGIGTIAAAFYPKPVIVRMSDFKTNEYAGLLAGAQFEPAEANPMLGFRGAARYMHPAYAEAFALECAALKRVREEMGLVNVRVMIPFCRRVDEARRVLDAMALNGLKRGEGDLEIYVMCEIPNNVVQIDAFARLFDGLSIGSNDLAQLTLGIDRDSDILAAEFDERDPGVLEMIRQAVEGARRNGIHSGICGQAPSDFPEFADYLVGLGIDSISLNPDSVLRMTIRVLDIEKRLQRVIA